MQKNKHRLALIVPIFRRRLENFNDGFELAFVMVGEWIEVFEQNDVTVFPFFLVEPR